MLATGTDPNIGSDSQTSRTLVIIEAPGKSMRLRELLNRLKLPGLEAVDVLATGGHFVGNPKRLDPLGLKFEAGPPARIKETLRAPYDTERTKRLAQSMSTRERIIIATDPDQEGDAIALDLAMLALEAAPGARLDRVELRALDLESIKSAFLDPRGVEPGAAVPARTRAIVDRLIGWSGSGEGVAVGRVLSPLLASFGMDRPPIGKVRVMWPAADWGEEFVAEIPVWSEKEAYHLQEELRNVAALMAGAPLKADPGRTIPLLMEPPHTGKLLAAGSRRLQAPVDDVAKVLQQLYEDGLITYPRSGKGKYSNAGLEAAARGAAAAGVRFDKLRAGAFRMEAGRDVHEAPRLVDPEKHAGLLRKHQESLGQHERMLSMMLEGMVSVGREMSMERPDPAAIARALRGDVSEKLGNVLAASDWVRATSPQKAPWETPGRTHELSGLNYTGFRKEAADVVVLERMMSLGLGRPSTWPTHTMKFVERGVVDENLRLTEKGRKWLSGTPDALRQAETSRLIEEDLDALAVLRDVDFEKLPPEVWEAKAVAILERRLGPIAGAFLTKLKDFELGKLKGNDEEAKAAVRAAREAVRDANSVAAQRERMIRENAGQGMKGLAALQAKAGRTLESTGPRNEE